MTNDEATYDALMKELEAEFSDLEELLDEEIEEADDQEAATVVIDLLEQASAAVARVRSTSGNGSDGDDETGRQIIENRLASVENSLAGMNTQLAETRQELAALRQLLANAH